jgi:ADP-L-glycero-D-manno-heptose 6-epimerase
MIVVTGAAGFIGGQTLLGLNEQQRFDILAVDDLTDGKKFQNLANARFLDYMDYEDFLEAIQNDRDFLEPITAVIHQGACSATTEWDGRFMMKVNYDYTKALYHYCLDRRIPFIYASSAAVYGGSHDFTEALEQQMPLNVYGYSKWLFDCYMKKRQNQHASQVVGLRYFNVYGPGEEHKGAMASVAYHFTRQLLANNEMRLFGEGEGFSAGEHLRDFIYVKDVVRIVLWMLDHPEVSGVYNVGTGQPSSFNALAKHLLAVHGGGAIQYIPFPDKLKGCYQSYTVANIQALRQQGCDLVFTSLAQGVSDYYRYLTKKSQPTFLI